MRAEKRMRAARFGGDSQSALAPAQSFTQRISCDDEVIDLSICSNVIGLHSCTLAIFWEKDKVKKQHYTFKFELLAANRILAGWAFELMGKELGRLYAIGLRLVVAACSMGQDVKH